MKLKSKVKQKDSYKVYNQIYDEVVNKISNSNFFKQMILQVENYDLEQKAKVEYNISKEKILNEISVGFSFKIELEIIDQLEKEKIANLQNL